MQLESGRILGQYEIVAPIGAGGMGEVYRARDRKIGRDVALKVMSPALRSNPVSLARSRREIRAMSTLSHPAIVTVFDIGESDGPDGITFIAMELIEGQSLREWLSHPHERQKVLEIFLQIADGLASAHAKGVVHRDLKPANIMVTPDGYAKIVDFGLAKLADLGASRPGEDDTTPLAVTAQGQIVGTLAYMSPEQLEGKDVDKRTDIFSFGCVLAEALNGRHPFAAPTMSAMLGRVAAGRFELPEPIAGDEGGTALNSLVSRCLAPDRDSRYRDMRAVADDLRRIARGASSGQTVTLTATREPRRRVRQVVALAAAIVVLICAILVISNRAQTRQHAAGLPPELADTYKRAQFLIQDRDEKVRARALPFLESVVAQAPAYVPARVTLAREYATRAFARDADRSWEEKAAIAVDKVLELDPKNAEAYELRGELAWMVSHAFAHEKALVAYNRALELDPRLATALSGRGSVLMHIGLLDGALRDFNRVLAADPQNEFALYRVARIHFYRGEYDEAIALFRRRFPQSAELAIALEHVGRSDDAVDLAEDLVARRPTNEDALSALAVIQAHRGQRDRALDAIRRAASSGEGSSHFHHAMYNLATAYALLGMPDEAMRWLNRTANEGLPCVPLFERDPFLDPLRKLPRFDAFLHDCRAISEPCRTLQGT